MTYSECSFHNELADLSPPLGGLATSPPSRHSAFFLENSYFRLNLSGGNDIAGWLSASTCASRELEATTDPRGIFSQGTQALKIVAGHLVQRTQT
jgi:hypothetical protein